MSSEKKCLRCGKELTGEQRKFCSDSCRALYHNYKEEEKICPQCWKIFIWKHHIKYCNQECINNAVVDKIWVSWKCLACWKDIRWINGKKFCDRKCKDRYKTHKTEEKICPTCWQSFIWTVWTKYCSEDCRQKGRDKSFRQTNLKKYWYEYPQQSKEIRDKWKDTLIKKYWIENIMQLDSIKKTVMEKSMKTNIERYWVPYYCLTDDCRDASKVISKINLKRESDLVNLWFTVEKEFNLWPRSYDLKIWDTLIEINPFPYHNSTRNPFWEPKDKTYHLDKLKLARDNWYRCIMVRDRDDFDKIIYLLDNNKQVIYARDCEVREVSHKECHDFFEAYHLQWDTRAYKNNIYIWLYYEDTLVECMSFWKPRYNKNYEREILRLCSHKDYRVVWWANKIYRYFLNLTQANSVVSYCDMSKFDWRVYEQLWFNLLKWNQPSKHRYSEGEILSMKHITDSLLRQRWYDQLFNESHGKWTSNEELMLQRGYVEIYDCGQATFVRNK